MGAFSRIPGIREEVKNRADSIKAYAVTADGVKEFTLALGGLTDTEREIILDGCLINYNRQ